MTLQGAVTYVGRFFPWIPSQRFLGISFDEPAFLLLCGLVSLLVLLSCSKTWARWTNSPIVYSLIYGSCFLTVGFGNSLGDSVQWKEGIHGRYYMSEPGATWIHHWAYYFLHTYFNIGVQSAISLTSRIAGVFYLFAVSALSLEVISRDDLRRVSLFRSVFFVAGFSLLFFGYIENTPLALPLEVFWIFLTVRLLKEPRWQSVVSSAFVLALAALIHGRVSFLAPALAWACFIPTGSFWVRARRVLLGGVTFTAVIVIAVSAIFALDSRHIMGSHLGNITGGGNRKMFVSMDTLLSVKHWKELGSTALIGGGLLMPLGLFAVLQGVLFRKDILFVWLAAYVLADFIYLGLWEFDFGYFIDWDLIFSGMVPLVFATALTLVRNKIWPVVLVLPVVSTGVLSLAFGLLINGEPFSLHVLPEAQSRKEKTVCMHPGLQRIFYADDGLSNPFGDPESDIPIHQWSTSTRTHPNNGRPFGATYQGYLYVPKGGAYRILLEATGNVRLQIGDQLLYERWSGFEWKVTLERGIKFIQEGWYPIKLDFYTKIHAIPLRLAIESRDLPLRPVTENDLCY